MYMSIVDFSKIEITVDGIQHNPELFEFTLKHMCKLSILLDIKVIAHHCKNFMIQIWNIMIENVEIWNIKRIEIWDIIIEISDIFTHVFIDYVRSINIQSYSMITDITQLAFNIIIDFHFNM